MGAGFPKVIVDNGEAIIVYPRLFVFTQVFREVLNSGTDANPFRKPPLLTGDNHLEQVIRRSSPAASNESGGAVPSRRKPVAGPTEGGIRPSEPVREPRRVCLCSCRLTLSSILVVRRLWFTFPLIPRLQGRKKTRSDSNLGQRETNSFRDCVRLNSLFGGRGGDQGRNSWA